MYSLQKDTMRRRSGRTVLGRRIRKGDMGAHLVGLRGHDVDRLPVVAVCEELGTFARARSTCARTRTTGADASRSRRHCCMERHERKGEELMDSSVFVLEDSKLPRLRT